MHNSEEELPGLPHIHLPRETPQQEDVGHRDYRSNIHFWFLKLWILAVSRPSINGGWGADLREGGKQAWEKRLLDLEYLIQVLALLE